MLQLQEKELWQELLICIYDVKNWIWRNLLPFWYADSNENKCYAVSAKELIVNGLYTAWNN